MLLYGVEFEPSIIILQILSLPFAMFSLARTCDAVLRGIDSPGIILSTTIVTSALKIGLGVWLIMEYGVIGAVIAFSIPPILSLPIYVTSISRKIGAKWPAGETIKIVLVALVMGCIVYLAQMPMGIVLKLVIGIPLGIVSYSLILMFLKVIDEEDLKLVARIEGQLPPFMQRYYAGLIKLVGKYAVKKRSPI